MDRSGKWRLFREQGGPNLKRIRLHPTLRSTLSTPERADAFSSALREVFIQTNEFYHLLAIEQSLCDDRSLTVAEVRVNSGYDQYLQKMSVQASAHPSSRAWSAYFSVVSYPPC
jgi:hypothetical protein